MTRLALVAQAGACASIVVPVIESNDRESGGVVTASVPGPSGDEGAQNDVRARAGRATFPRGMRLLRHADFERVYKQGRRHFSANMSVFYLLRDDSSKTPTLRQAQGRLSRAKGAREMGHPARENTGMRVGFTVGRALGGAVARNRMKRRLREAVRLTRPLSAIPVDVVINPKKSLLSVEFGSVLAEVRRAFEVIEKNCTEYRVPSSERGREETRGRN